MNDADLTIFCLPHAGGSSLLFKNWQRRLPAGCVIHAVPLPGRGSRIGQPPIGDYRALVQWIARHIQAHAAGARRSGEPFCYALFGHSAGGRFAFGVAAELTATYELAPLHCFLAACGPPHWGVDQPKQPPLSDAQLTEAIRAKGGTPPEVLADPRLWAMVLPIVRADLRASGQAIEDKDRRLSCPMTLIAWDKDREVRPEGVWAWEAYTSGRARRALLEGDHFSVLRDPAVLLLEIRADVEQILPVAGSRVVNPEARCDSTRKAICD